MHTIYRIPGMGLDKRVFSKLEFPEGYEVVDIEWRRYAGVTTLGDYARALIDEFDFNKPFSLVGLSMGGMIVIEMMKYIKPERAMIISSAKKRNELPWRARFIGNTGLYKLVPSKLMKSVAILMIKKLVSLPQKQHETLVDMLASCDAKFFKWSLGAITTWDNKEVRGEVVHIHGDKDRTIFFKNIKEPVIVIEGGTHFMAGNRAGEINKIIKNTLPAPGDTK